MIQKRLNIVPLSKRANEASSFVSLFSSFIFFLYGYSLFFGIYCVARAAKHRSYRKRFSKTHNQWNKDLNRKRWMSWNWGCIEMYKCILAFIFIFCFSSSCLCSPLMVLLFFMFSFLRLFVRSYSQRHRKIGVEN